MPLNVRVGFFLALRALRRAPIWTTSLIIFVMLLTFLNLVVVTGILVGLVIGINEGYRTQYIGDLVIQPLPGERYIENTPAILDLLTSLPQVDHYTARYVESGVVDADYKKRTDPNDKTNRTGLEIAGIDPRAEDAFSNFSQLVVEGEYLSPGDYDQILIGSQLLDQYAFGEQPGFTILKGVHVGSKLRMEVGGAVREVTVKGIVKSKLAELSIRAYMVDSQFRGLIGRSDYNVDELAVKFREGTNAFAIKELLVKSGVGKYGRVRTFEESIPPGVNDITNTFRMLGNMLSSVGLLVASITIFIVIFINALTRRKYIGILKGIGVSGRAIEISYIFQSIFYAVIGSSIGLLILYGFLVPFVAAHPIDFPFSDGILVAPLGETLFRVALLVFATLIAGFIPAWMIVRRNTLDSILGRN